jgi:hypothetical protein
VTNRFAFTNEQLKLIQDQLGPESFFRGATVAMEMARIHGGCRVQALGATMYLLVSPTQFSVITHTLRPPMCCCYSSMRAVLRNMARRPCQSRPPARGQVVTNALPKAIPAATFKRHLRPPSLYSHVYAITLNWVTEHLGALDSSDLTPKPAAAPTVEIERLSAREKPLPTTLR